MKNIIYILIVMICLLFGGCKDKIDCEISDCIGHFRSEGSSDSINPLFAVLEAVYLESSNDCYYIKNYEEFDNFIEEHKLMMSNEIEDKYNNEFFINKSLVILPRLSSAPGDKFSFHLSKEDNKLIIKVTEKCKKGNAYSDTLTSPHLFFIDILSEDLKDVTIIEISNNIKYYR